MRRPLLRRERGLEQHRRPEPPVPVQPLPCRRMEPLARLGHLQLRGQRRVPLCLDQRARPAESAVGFLAHACHAVRRLWPGQIVQTGVAAGTSLALSVSGTPATSHQAALTADYGFVDFVSGDGLSSVEVARPLAVATTANGANDADAVVRLRQNGVNDVSVMFYKVADYAGTVDGLAPGQAGYAEAAPPMPTAPSAARRPFQEPAMAPLQPDRTRPCECGRSHRHEAHQQRRNVLGLRLGQ